VGKLQVFESISVDGYFTDPRGDLSWAHAGTEDPEFDDWVGNNASGGGALLLGRVTYQMMEAFWPTPAAEKQMPRVAKGMNAARKYVASRTLKPTWTNSRLLEGDLVEAVKTLKRGEDLTVLGSGNVAAQLGEGGWSMGISSWSSRSPSAAGGRCSTRPESSGWSSIAPFDPARSS